MNSIPTQRSLLQYSFLALPLAFAGLPLYVHAPDFYARDLGLSIGLIGVILLVIRLFDAIQDPVIGYISDRFVLYRDKIIYFGAVCLLMGIGLLFAGPSAGVSAVFCFVFGIFLATTGFSIVAINLTTVGSFWHKDAHERTRISAYREGFMLVGLLIAALVPTLLQSQFSSQDVFLIMAVIFTCLLTFSLILFRTFLKNIPQSDVAYESYGFHFFKILVGPHRLFFGLFFITVMAASLPSALVLFFIEDYLQVQGYSGLFLFLYFVTGAAALPLWTLLSKKIGREKTWMISIFLGVLTFVWAGFLDVGDVLAYAFICALSGAALGPDLALPPAILADLISEKNEEGKGSQNFAVLSVIPKVALAVASGFAFITLSILGFEAGADNSERALNGLVALYAFVPCAIKLCSAVLLWRFIQQKGKYNEDDERSRTYDCIRVS